ncbi:MAG: LuxR C-terminal-related transcriptional regulator [Acidimicrobiales bacterium]
MTASLTSATGSWPVRPSPASNGSARTLRTPAHSPSPAELPGRDRRPLPVRDDAPRVLVLDSNLLTAEAISLALNQMTYLARFVVPVTPGHLRDVMEWRPGLALIDVDSVEPATSIECVGVLRARDVPVAVMSGRADTYFLGECVDAGAAWVVDKGSPIVALSRDIARLLAGEEVLREDRRLALTGSFRREARARRDRMAPFGVLTHREQHVLAELMDGHGADAIARRASVSTSTVRSQIKAVLQKLGVNSQLAAAALASQAGWAYELDGRPPVPAVPAAHPGG